MPKKLNLDLSHREDGEEGKREDVKGLTLTRDKNNDMKMGTTI